MHQCGQAWIAGHVHHAVHAWERAMRACSCHAVHGVCTSPCELRCKARSLEVHGCICGMRRHSTWKIVCVGGVRRWNAAWIPPICMVPWGVARHVHGRLCPNFRRIEPICGFISVLDSNHAWRAEDHGATPGIAAQDLDFLGRMFPYLLPNHVHHNAACFTCLFLAHESSGHGDRRAIVLQTKAFNVRMRGDALRLGGGCHLLDPHG